ncbi:hypothetical protein [Dyella caseinilytica]|uniref:Uncharacterized protein n=1 Tax=Dyella caseinilytica TaxID=1849581 RepID=A0ABX7GVV5_9GAMM|nr:hypothetical protein [Dyella caseinilytica]QRN54434.1 hypothetical protein ISN74_03390 [Dyella caseinilytica]GFZ94208.1 hypothetical protein GCM10011408_12560 [Dyella caseinilytica]
MKLVSASSTAAVLLGISALMHPATSFALPSCQICDGWYTECQSDPGSSACSSWDSLCHNCPPPKAVHGAPPTKHDDKSATAVLNSRHATPAASQAK